ALADAATVVLEVEAEGVFARAEFLVRGDPVFVLFLVRECVYEHRLAVQYQQAPAAEAPALGSEHATRAAVRDLDLSGHTVRFVLYVGRGGLGNADHAWVVGKHCAPAGKTGPDRWIDPLGQ